MAGRPALATWKKVVFAVVTIVALFAATEAILAVVGVKPLLVTDDPFVGFASNVPLFVEQVQPDGTIMLVTAANKLGYFNAQRFPKAKGRNTYRIFCLGGSTTYGHPFEDSTSFCGWLRDFLTAADPSRTWEVINAGGISYASYRDANLMLELSRYQPDLFILYESQNEFLEDRTYRSIIDTPGWIVRTKGELSRSRVYSLLTRALERPAKNRKGEGRGDSVLNGEVSEILNDTIGPTSYTRDVALNRAVISHFAFELRRMVAIARSSGSDILFISPASNLKDMEPFKSEEKAGQSSVERLRWEREFSKGKRLIGQGRDAEALETLRQAQSMDDGYAELYYLEGKALFALGRYEEAQRAFQRAVDEDICPLRMTSPMTKAVHETAAESKAPLVDFARVLEQDCYRKYGHKILGKEYFLDHVHPTIEGYRMLGLALFDELVRQGIARPNPRWGAQAVAAVTRNVENGIDLRKKAHALIMLGKTLDWAGKLEEGHKLLSEAYRLLQDNSYNVLDTLANSSARRGKILEAIEYYRKALLYPPVDATTHFFLAYYLQESGRSHYALAEYEETIRICRSLQEGKTAGAGRFTSSLPVEENIANSHYNMALILSKEGRAEAAIAHYAEVLKVRPDRAEALMDMGVLLAEEGKNAEAIGVLSKAVEIRPGSAKAHYDLALILDKTGKPDEAIVQYAAALKIDPSSAETRNNLGVIYAKQGRLSEAEEQFRAAIEAHPDNADAHYNLGMALARLGRTREAELQAFEAQKIRAARGSKKASP